MLGLLADTCALKATKITRLGKIKSNFNRPAIRPMEKTMRTVVVNRDGKEWWFYSVKDAKPHIKKAKFRDFEIQIVNGEKVRVYDDRSN